MDQPHSKKTYDVCVCKIVGTTWALFKADYLGGETNACCLGPWRSRIQKRSSCTPKRSFGIFPCGPFQIFKCNMSCGPWCHQVYAYAWYSITFSAQKLHDQIVYRQCPAHTSDYQIAFFISSYETKSEIVVVVVAFSKVSGDMGTQCRKRNRRVYMRWLRSVCVCFIHEKNASQQLVCAHCKKGFRGNPVLHHARNFGFGSIRGASTWLVLTAVCPLSLLCRLTI